MDTGTVMLVTFCGVFFALMLGTGLGLFLAAYVAVWLGWVAFVTVGLGGSGLVAWKMVKLIDG